MHLLQLAANETAVVNDGEDVRLKITATPTEAGDAAAVRVQAGADESDGRGQKLEVGETLVIVFKQGRPDEYPDPEGGDPLPFKPYADYDPDSDDDDDDDDDVIDLKNQVQVTLVHIYGDEAVLRFAVPDEWGVAVAIERE